MGVLGTSGNTIEDSFKSLESIAESWTNAVGLKLASPSRELATSDAVDVAAIFLKIASNSDSNSASSMTLN